MYLCENIYIYDVYINFEYGILKEIWFNWDLSKDWK